MTLQTLWWRNPNVNKMAFSGPLSCPHCVSRYGSDYDVKKQKWHLDKYLTPTRIRYVCKHCKGGVIYDISK